MQGYLEVEIIPEDLMIPVGGHLCLIPISGKDFLGDFTAYAGRCTDEAFVVLLELVDVDAWTRVLHG